MRSLGTKPPLEAGKTSSVSSLFFSLSSRLSLPLYLSHSSSLFLVSNATKLLHSSCYFSAENGPFLFSAFIAIDGQCNSATLHPTAHVLELLQFSQAIVPVLHCRELLKRGAMHLFVLEHFALSVITCVSIYTLFFFFRFCVFNSTQTHKIYFFFSTYNCII